MQAETVALRAEVMQLKAQVSHLTEHVAGLKAEVEHERRLRMMAEGTAAEEQSKYRALRSSRAAFR